MKEMTIDGVEYVLYPKQDFLKLQENVLAQKELITELKKEVKQ